MFGPFKQCELFDKLYKITWFSSSQGGFRPLFRSTRENVGFLVSLFSGRFPTEKQILGRKEARAPHHPEFFLPVYHKLLSNALENAHKF